MQWLRIDTLCDTLGMDVEKVSSQNRCLMELTVCMQWPQRQARQ